MWLERLEKLAYNALPAAISPDMWSHQYDPNDKSGCRLPYVEAAFPHK